MERETENSQLVHASPWIDGSMETLSSFVKKYDLKIKKYDRGHIFYGQEENSDFVYLIKKGRICLSLDNMNGNEKSIFIADEGMIFGKLSAIDGMPNCCNAIAISDEVLVYQIPKRIFIEEMNTELSFSREVIRMMSKTIRSLISQIRLLTFNSSQAKVCYALFHMINQYSSPYRDGYKINITFTHQQIGELIGLSRVSVSNILSKMVKENVIRKKEGYYYVKDLDSIYEHIFEETEK